jgi:small subunit ribosomal protein S19
MTRSLWKGPFVASTLFSSKKNYVWSRHSSILPQFVNKKFQIHNGKSFIEIEIQESMIGHKFGEFALTRKRPVHKKKEKRK